MDDRRELAIESRLGRIEAKVEHLEKGVDTLVSRVEFTPIKLTVYGMVGIILAAVVGALVAMVVRQ